MLRFLNFKKDDNSVCFCRLFLYTKIILTQAAVKIKLLTKQNPVNSVERCSWPVFLDRRP